MQRIRVAGAVVNQLPLDWSGNRLRLERALAAAREAGVSVLCLPELCIPGYGCEDAFHSLGVARRSLRLLEQLLPSTRGMVCAIGLPFAVRNALFNTIALVADGRLVGLVGKRFLAGDGIHYEPRWFKRMPAGTWIELEVFGETVPFGNILFDIGGVKIGFEICEDAWVANRPGQELSFCGADIILNPSASHFAFAKVRTRRQFVIEGSRSLGLTYVYTNLVGLEAGRVIFDGGVLIAHGGNLVAAGPRLFFHDVSLSSAVVDIDEGRMLRQRTVSFDPNLGASPLHLVSADFAWPEEVVAGPEDNRHLDHSFEHRNFKELEFARAVALGLFDYLRKSWSKGFVLSISGGADSAACAVLIASAFRLAAHDIGLDGLKARLAYLPWVSACEDVEAMLPRLLTCVYQATENSGPVTAEAARKISEAVGADFHHVSVQALVEGYRALAEGVLGRAMSWEQDDLALQNIQARVRAPGIWMLANVRGALLVATSNRSEAAVGYTTMDGDTCGGVSPIAGIDKNFLRAWLRWMETEAPPELAPIAALSYVNRQQPTAELRPQEEHQTDESDLMPFDLLDAVEKAAIRDRKEPIEVFEALRPRFAERFGLVRLGQYVAKFFKLWCRNQWKRERFAPSFHLDDENLDPKTWCRFPILSGGYKEELAALEAHVRALA